MAGTSDSISEGLGRYSIGGKLRALRLRNHMGLVELGKHTSLSAPQLSRLERGKLFPTLPTLMRIAMVFGVGLDESLSIHPRSRTPNFRKWHRRRRKRTSIRGWSFCLS